MGIWQIECYARDCLLARERLSLLLHGSVDTGTSRTCVANDIAGYYIHSCVKMRYKADFRPQYILGALPGFSQKTH